MKDSILNFLKVVGCFVLNVHYWEKSITVNDNSNFEDELICNSCGMTYKNFLETGKP